MSDRLPLVGPIDQVPVGIVKGEAIQALDDALAGVPLGAYDEHIKGWLTTWDTGTIVVFGSLFERVRQEGYREGRKDALRATVQAVEAFQRELATWLLRNGPEPHPEEEQD